MFFGRKGKATGSREIAGSLVDDRRQPPLASGDSMHTYSQNVAGLWLKYGAKSPNIETFSHRKILEHDATIF
jgi:hypothetical protein